MEDPLGQAIYDYHYLGYAKEIIIHTNYTEDEHLEPQYFFRNEKDMPLLEKTALNLCRGRILDVGAGAGSHSLILQKRGLDVTALEASSLAAAVIKDRGVHKVVCADIYEFSGLSYDTILMLMNGTGLGGTIDGLQKLLLHLKSLLTEHGRLLIDSSDIRYLFEEEDGSVWVELTSDEYYGEMSYNVIYKDQQTNFNWLFVDYEKLSELAFSAGLRCHLIEEGSNYDYLAQLVLNR